MHDRLLGATVEWPSQQAKVAFVEEAAPAPGTVRGELGSGNEVV
jgi:hypothetical protein